MRIFGVLLSQFAVGVSNRLESKKRHTVDWQEVIQFESFHICISLTLEKIKKVTRHINIPQDALNAIALTFGYFIISLQ